MKRNQYLLASILTLFINISCKKDFLDVVDPNTATKQGYIVDLKATGEYLNGIYITIATQLYSQNGITIYPDIIADNIKLVNASAQYFAQPYYWLQVTSTTATGSKNANVIWLNGYQIIRSCNLVIEKAEQYKSQNVEQANDMKAQALAIRSLINFLLVNTFAQPYRFTADGAHPGIPYIVSSDWTVPLKGRQTVAEVYAHLVSDLKDALPMFSSSRNSLYMNQNAAKALLARVYLFKEDYSNARILANEVCQKVPLMGGGAGGYPSKLFTPNETEALFQLPPSKTDYSTQFIAANFSPTYYVQFLPTLDITGILQENPSDKRNAWITNTGGKWYISKFPSGVVPGVTPAAGSYYQTILRSSEMYLTAAESYAKLSIEDSARIYLDAIRLRAVPDAVPSTATGTALLDSIYKERRKELAFEGIRMFDLLRWGKGVDRTDAWVPTARNLPFPSQKAIAPIPQNDIEASGLTQNPGY